MNPELGKLITDDQERDAIHIAIVPVIAAEMLPPGQHVGLWNNKYLSVEIPLVGICHNPIGIVDPFLKRDVQKGQKFWLFLYPNTVTSLKHHWTHPAFKDQVPIPDLPENILQSKKWMEDLANIYASYRYGHNGDSAYDWLMKEADKIVEGEESYIVFNVDCHGEIDPQEFWTHYQIIRGRFVNLDVTENIFSCSC